MTKKPKRVKIGMRRQIYFAGDAFVVNDRKIGYKRLNDGEEILVESLENDDMKKNI